MILFNFLQNRTFPTLKKPVYKTSNVYQNEISLSNEIDGSVYFTYSNQYHNNILSNNIQNLYSQTAVYLLLIQMIN